MPHHTAEAQIPYARSVNEAAAGEADLAVAAVLATVWKPHWAALDMSATALVERRI